MGKIVRMIRGLGKYELKLIILAHRLYLAWERD